jgi:hypothetical protein
MYSFLYDFTLWANECPHFDTMVLKLAGGHTFEDIVGPTANVVGRCQRVRRPAQMI